MEVSGAEDPFADDDFGDFTGVSMPAAHEEKAEVDIGAKMVAADPAAPADAFGIVKAASGDALADDEVFGEFGSAPAVPVAPGSSTAGEDAFGEFGGAPAPATDSQANGHDGGGGLAAAVAAEPVSDSPSGPYEDPFGAFDVIPVAAPDASANTSGGLGGGEGEGLPGLPTSEERNGTAVGNERGDFGEFDGASVTLVSAATQGSSPGRGAAEPLPESTDGAEAASVLGGKDRAVGGSDNLRGDDDDQGSGALGDMPVALKEEELVAKARSSVPEEHEDRLAPGAADCPHLAPGEAAEAPVAAATAALGEGVAVNDGQTSTAVKISEESVRNDAVGTGEGEVGPFDEALVVPASRPSDGLAEESAGAVLEGAGTEGARPTEDNSLGGSGDAPLFAVAQGSAPVCDTAEDAVTPTVAGDEGETGDDGDDDGFGGFGAAPPIASTRDGPEGAVATEGGASAEVGASAEADEDDFGDFGEASLSFEKDQGTTPESDADAGAAESATADDDAEDGADRGQDDDDGFGDFDAAPAAADDFGGFAEAPAATTGVDAEAAESATADDDAEDGADRGQDDDDGFGDFDAAPAAADDFGGFAEAPAATTAPSVASEAIVEAFVACSAEAYRQACAGEEASSLSPEAEKQFIAFSRGVAAAFAPVHSALEASGQPRTFSLDVKTRRRAAPSRRDSRSGSWGQDAHVEQTIAVGALAAAEARVLEELCTVNAEDDPPTFQDALAARNVVPVLSPNKPSTGFDDLTVLAATAAPVMAAATAPATTTATDTQMQMQASSLDLDFLAGPMTSGQPTSTEKGDGAAFMDGFFDLTADVVGPGSVEKVPALTPEEAFLKTLPDLRFMLADTIVDPTEVIAAGTAIGETAQTQASALDDLMSFL